eukprot:145403_1
MKSTLGLRNEKEAIARTGVELVKKFLSSHTCYDMLKPSGKVLVFDSNISIHLAFYGLVEHDIQAAPIWDSRKRRFVGLMTVTDYIDILRQCTHRVVTVEQLAFRTIAEVLSQPEGRRLKQEDFAFVTADSTLEIASAIFHDHKIKFLPVVVPGENSVLAIISHLEVIEFLVNTFREKRKGFFQSSVIELRIGVFDNIITMQQGAKLSEVLELLELYNIGAVPVLDEQGKVIDMYSRSDFTFLATASTPKAILQNLDCKLSDILKEAGSTPFREGRNRDPLITCSPQDSLQTIFEIFSRTKFRRIVCVDVDGRCRGLISVSDLLRYFTL